MCCDFSIVINKFALLDCKVEEWVQILSFLQQNFWFFIVKYVIDDLPPKLFSMKNTEQANKK